MTQETIASTSNSAPEQSKIRIITNNVPRDVIQAHELTKQEQEEFDYLDWQAIENGTDNAEFFRYKGELYDIGEFSRIIAPGARRCHPMECSEQAFQAWHGYKSDSFFSGLLIRYVNDYEQVIVARYCS